MGRCDRHRVQVSGGRHRPEHVRCRHAVLSDGTIWGRHYAQAHNDYLQLAAEGGLLLTIPAALSVCAFIVAVRRRFVEETSVRTYWLRVGAVTGLTAIALQETVEFSLQMPGNAALFAVVCAIALHRTPERHSGP